MISLKQLEAFLTSAKWGSFVAAAARLNTTQSNVSKRIQELEWAVGEPVFERGPKSLTLTIKGKQLLPHAEDVLATYNKLVEAAASGSAVSGPFSLGSSSTIAESWLSVFIQRVRDQYPGIVLNSQVAALPRLIVQLQSGAVDLLLGPIAGDMGEFEVIPLATEELLWVCHPKLAPRESTLTLERLAQLPMIQHPSNENQVSRMFTDRGIRPNTVATCSSFLTRARFAVSGLGLTHLPRYIVERELANGRLVEIRCKTPPPPIRYGAAFRRGETSPLPMKLAQIAVDACDFKLLLQ